MILYSPLSIQARNKKFILNLNVFRNAHFQILNRAKVNYKAAMAEQILDLPRMNKIELIYTLYPSTKRRTDTNNVLSIHDKFFCDSLVELNKLPDDDYKHVVGTSFRFGEVDKNNGRVTIEIKEID